MDMLDNIKKMFEDGAKKIQEFVNQFAGGNPVGDMINQFYQQVFSQSKNMMDQLLKNDIYKKIMSDMEKYKDDIMGKFSDLTKNFGDFKKIQEQFEKFMSEGNKKLMELTNGSLKDGFEKFQKTIMDQIKNFDFTKFFQAPTSTKKTTTTAKKSA